MAAPLSTEKLRYIASLHDAGVPIAEIAASACVSASAVRSALKSPRMADVRKMFGDSLVSPLLRARMSYLLDKALGKMDALMDSAEVWASLQASQTVTALAVRMMPPEAQTVDVVLTSKFMQDGPSDDADSGDMSGDPSSRSFGDATGSKSVDLST